MLLRITQKSLELLNFWTQFCCESKFFGIPYEIFITCYFSQIKVQIRQVPPTSYSAIEAI